MVQKEDFQDLSAIRQTILLTMLDITQPSRLEMSERTISSALGEHLFEGHGGGVEDDCVCEQL